MNGDCKLGWYTVMVVIVSVMGGFIIGVNQPISFEDHSTIFNEGHFKGYFEGYDNGKIDSNSICEDKIWNKVSSLCESKHTYISNNYRDLVCILTRDDELKKELEDRFVGGSLND